MPLPAALSDELTTINAIYPPDTLSLDESSVILKLPPHVSHLSSTTLRLSFPDTYPASPPTISGPHSTAPGARPGEAHHLADLARAALAASFVPDEPCVFGLVEELLARLDSEPSPDPPPSSTDAAPEDTDTVTVAEAESDILPAELAPAWSLSDALAEKKSQFIGRAARVTSVEQAQAYLRHLLATDRRAARATHNICAWRVAGANGTLQQDSDDDGESAAGGQVLALLQLMDARGVLVVVTRWYGGIHLGPDRFRIIKSVAREALGRAGFTGSSTKKAP